MKQQEFNQERAKRYHLAMSSIPSARNSELERLELNINLNKEELVILDLGAGDGFLTRHIRKIFPNAKIYALDASESMLSENTKGKFNIINSDSDNIPLKDNSVDLVVSLATFHHIKKKKETFQEIKRILVNNGQFIIADVLDKTNTQKFFDTIVKNYCITGHDFPFLSKELVKELANQSSLIHKESKLKETPWKFNSREDMAFFVKNLVGLDISIDFLLKFLYENFSIKLRNNKIQLGWQLGYHVLQKKEEKL
ncbi:MAG: class I SAM-dependent methyltransferase [Candidatus Nanoarchaeia archaeon]